MPFGLCNYTPPTAHPKRKKGRESYDTSRLVAQIN